MIQIKPGVLILKLWFYIWMAIILSRNLPNTTGKALDCTHTLTHTSYWGLWWVIQTVKTWRLQRGFWETWSPPSESVQTASHGPEGRRTSAYTRAIMCCVSSRLQWVVPYLIIKGKASTHHLIHDDSQTPPVHRSPVIIVLQYLINNITWSIRRTTPHP